MQYIYLLQNIQIYVKYEYKINIRKYRNMYNKLIYKKRKKKERIFNHNFIIMNIES